MHSMFLWFKMFAQGLRRVCAGFTQGPSGKLQRRTVLIRASKLVDFGWLLAREVEIDFSGRPGTQPVIKHQNMCYIDDSVVK